MTAFRLSGVTCRLAAIAGTAVLTMVESSCSMNNPDNPAQLRNMEAEAVRTDAQLQAVVDSVNRYSLTVYDINIGDNRSSTLLSTNPDNEDNPLPVRPDLSQLREIGRAH